MTRLHYYVLSAMVAFAVSTTVVTIGKDDSLRELGALRPPNHYIHMDGLVSDSGF